jgi:hypothetical protein
MMIEKGQGEALHGTVYAIDQLATVMASDDGTVATLTTTNAKLTSQLEAAQAYIKTLKDEILALTVNIKPASEVDEQQYVLLVARSSVSQ